MKTRVRTVADMRRLGAMLAKQLLPGDVLVLQGDLGAGKSELVRGIAEGLSIQDSIPSPTFTIMNAYSSGRVPLYHFDWYRLQQVEELYEMGLDEFLGGDGIAAVEWAERFPEAVPPDHLLIQISASADGVRMVDITPAGEFRRLVDQEGQA